MQRDIHGYLKNGIKFDMKVIKAVHEDVIRVHKAENDFKQEARENNDLQEELILRKQVKQKAGKQKGE